ncbi:Uncharacterized conserved protein YkwD, contains CAP (CSP/antigen 5/PR1) domain [Amycolatopsis arida]|uniref:Uncharacterized conserved protein YkwD, contains CAP (CSP/antigen 5/PR1) domain n=1 Tax=Amycolatopsis arida TaxID=587909 RepID=A0A1I5TAB8_9PSEU|nr:Uncharacterized conserved protein YkwD, contains CAP (CSP/antigen 5/PR1) domain [Amycolatopsis arida]
MLVALSVLVGVALAASSQLVLRDWPSDHPDLAGAPTLAASLPRGGAFGAGEEPAGAGVDGGGSAVTTPPTSDTDDPEGTADPAETTTTEAEETSGESAPSGTSTGTPAGAAPRGDTTSEPRRAPAPPPSSDPPARSGSHADRVVELVNQARSSAGCGSLRVDARLTKAAQGHSDDMSARGYFSHTTPEGVTFAERVRAAGYPRPGGENIARGARSAEQVMRMWMSSDGHRRNILNCSFRAIGVGVTTAGWYWTQNFGY